MRVRLCFVALSALFCLALSKSAGASDRIVLHADNHTGRDAVWQKRHRYGRATWGIRGSGKVESGLIWFDHFPGESGEYRIILRGVFEQDGAPFYAVRAGGRTLAEGRFPYLTGKLVCDGEGAPGKLDLGVHRLNRGEKVALWGKSIYECGSHGAYTLWDRLVFIRQTSAVLNKRYRPKPAPLPQ